jgi:hypothetical protein
MSSSGGGNVLNTSVSTVSSLLSGANKAAGFVLPKLKIKK